MAGLNRSGLLALVSQAHSRLTVTIRKIDPKLWPDVKQEVEAAVSSLEKALKVLQTPRSQQ